MTSAVRRSGRARIAELIEGRVPFVLATVVRAQCPTSARPGDSAAVLADGTIEGFIGGVCAEGSVRVAALPLLESGEPLLLRILPEGGEEFPESEGATTVINPCLSGGAVEVFLEPKLPAPKLTVVGSTPIADALVDMAGVMGFASPSVSDPGAWAAAGAELPAAEMEGALAVVIASHGRGEPEAIRRALDAGVGFVGLVASRRRGAAVLDEMDLSAAERERVHSPVGLDIGARTAEEIALSILGQLVSEMRRGGLRAPVVRRGTTRPETAVDPVCGMTVVVTADTPHLNHGGDHHWFCNPGCRDRYAEELGPAT
ncbi:MAG TPA: carbon monoxide dehydrogenase accessory protein [Acidimicrobiales bacterium]|nr:carbon monoxide dehydrogenase accessory protein [Acidimicrobiales bacterium]